MKIKLNIMLYFFVIFLVVFSMRLVAQKDENKIAKKKKISRSQGHLSLSVKQSSQEENVPLIDALDEFDLFRDELVDNKVDVLPISVVPELISVPEVRSGELPIIEKATKEPEKILEKQDTAPDQDVLEEIKFVKPVQLEKEKEVDRPYEQSKRNNNLRNKNDEDKIVFNFENADLKNVISYIEKVFNLTFITDESIDPLQKDGKRISGNKVTFKTQKPLVKKEAWNLFVTFLKMSGLAPVPQADPNIYRIVASDQAMKSPVRSYIGADPEDLPDSDELINYGYFVKVCPLDTIMAVVEQLKGQGTPSIKLPSHNAFLLTDSAYNIKVLMKVVVELDRVSMPETMSVLKLKRVDAKDVEELYKELTKKDDQSVMATRIFGPERPPAALYFPETARIIVEKRTNSLILMGTRKAIKKIEDFITKHVDVEVTAPYSPWYIYNLRYASAENIANIMTPLVQFGKPAMRSVGGVRAGEKYFKSMTFTPEKDGNRLVVRGDYDDWLKVKEIIAKLDEPQPQVALEVLILSIDIKDNRELGAQLRSKAPFTNSRLNKSISFQTSGLRLGGGPKGIVENDDSDAKGVTRLLGDLVKLVAGATPGGNTVLSLGADLFGVWGIFAALQTIGNTQLISNPFLIVSNNTPAKVVLGETRRVVSQVIQSQATTQAFQNLEANLELDVVPQINSEGMIVLNLEVKVDTFVPDTVASQFKKKIKTTVVVSDREVLALGGLIKDRASNSMSDFPILGKIPILSWLVKNKSKVKQKEDLLILISANIIGPEEGPVAFTNRHVKDYKQDLQSVEYTQQKRDPIDKSFFIAQRSDDSIENFIFEKTRFDNKEDTKSLKSPKTHKQNKRRMRKKNKSRRKNNKRKQRSKKGL